MQTFEDNKLSKQNKLKIKLLKKPPPVDFTWSDFVTLMNSLNFKESCTGGSHYMFEHTSGFKFGASKTHPSGVLKQYQIKEAISALIATGEWNEDDE